MKTFLRKWRGPVAALVLLATTLSASAVTTVKTLGGGPNQTSSARSGSTDGDTFAFAKFSNPFAVALDSNGNLFIADRNNGKVRKVTNPGAVDSLTSTFASGLRSPVGVAVDSSNVVYVITQGDGKLRKFSANGTLLQTVIGLKSPTALALNATGTVFVTELGGAVRQIAPDGSITLIASGFHKPHGIAVLGNGLLAVSSTSGHAIYTVDPLTGMSTLVAGGTGAGFSDGSGLTAKFNQPFGLAVAPNGMLVVADFKNNRIRVISDVGTNNVVSTLLGISSKDWTKPFAGWRDGAAGENGVAATRQPVGLTVGPNGTVFFTETYWDLIRQAVGTGLQGNEIYGTNATGIATNDVTVGTNTVRVIGTNTVSLGFESGEGSSDFIGAAGQHFYAPVTLTVSPGQSVYTFQMSLSATGETGVALNPFESGFASMVMRPDTNSGFYVPILPNYTFLNSTLDLLGVGWLERYTQTNLYNTLGQDLITYSIAKDTLFGKATGRVIFGAYRVPIPNGAAETDSFRVALNNPSGTSDGVSQPVALRVPTDGSLGAGALNTIKRITLASRAYIVGDCVPFRWFNAGEFGDGALANNDVVNLFETAVYDFNSAIPDSDLFNAMDSSDGSSGSVSFGDDVSVNTIINGDGVLAVDDVWVTFRRSLDPTLKWYARYWSNGALQVIEVTNTLMSGFESSSASAPVRRSAAPAQAPASRPTANLTVSDIATTAGAALQLPVQLSLSDGYAARVMMLNVTVEALDGSPAINTPIQFQTSPAFHNPELNDSRGANNYAAAWLDNTIAGLSGDSLLAFLSVQVPANAGPHAAYRVHFDHFSVSPNGTALFDAHATTGLILLSDRSASTWNDGISDAWRLRYFGSIFSPDSAPGADADGDGVINSIEYQNGTDPTDATSR